jgi:hypothetical protein
MAASNRLTPQQRVLRAKIAAYTHVAHSDPKEMTKAARAGFMARFEREVDPDGVLSEEERQRRAKAAMRAHMARLRLARTLKNQMPNRAS